MIDAGSEGDAGGGGHAGGGTVHVVLPGNVDDPAAPSGGNGYDRRLCQGLSGAGWSVQELPVPGSWPAAGPAERAALAERLAAVPDGALVLLDGLVACPAPEVVVPHAQRLRLVVLVHLSLADETGLAPDRAAELNDRERETLHAAAAVLATSDWAAGRLVEQHGLPADRVHVAAPGVDAGTPVAGTEGGSRLLCVAAVTPRKGQDLLVEALAQTQDAPWSCRLVGAVDRVPDYAERVRAQVSAHRLEDRITLTGPRTGDALAASYAAADLLVLASRAETYGMVVTEALARGIPVLATEVGGVPAALGHAPDGSRPGMLVPPADPAALAGALRRWLTEPDLRDRLRCSATARRAVLPGWDATVAAVAGVLERAAMSEDRSLRGPQVHAQHDGVSEDRSLRGPQVHAQHDGVSEDGSLRGPQVHAQHESETAYSPAWLALREPADAAARADELLSPLRNLLHGRLAGGDLAGGDLAGADLAGGDLVIGDLGCGTGSMGRWLAGRLPGPQHWILYDRDPDLLDHAAASLAAAEVTVETRQQDVAALTAADLTGASLVTASALLDLLTREEVDRLAAACLGAGCPALLTLSVVGAVEFTPADPLDLELAAAFSDHQRRVVDGRRLLGPDAVDATAEAFRRRGATVREAPSPWRLGAAQSGLIGVWLRGWVGAACEQRPELADPAAAYLDRRLAAAAAGKLRVRVGHRDLLAYAG